MMPLMDMMLNMQNGEAVKQLARQFQLTQEQTVKAMEALMPAFSEGLKRNAGDPFGVANFMNALASGNHAAYVDNMTRAFQPQGLDDGNGILGHLFGSKEVSRAIAQQAAAMTGISEIVLKQMLPALATLIMGGLFKQSTGQFGGGGAAGNPVAQMMEQMMRQSASMGGAMMGGMQAAPRAEPQNPFDNPFGKVLEQMFGGARQTPQQNPMGDNPLGRIFEDMMRGGFGGAQPGRPAPEPENQSDPSGRERTAYDDIFGEMFDSGRRTRDEYERNITNIFDQFLKGMDRSR